MNCVESSNRAEEGAHLYDHGRVVQSCGSMVMVILQYKQEGVKKETGEIPIFT